MANSAGRGALSASLPFASSDGSDVPRALEKCLRAYGTAPALVRTRYARLGVHGAIEGIGSAELGRLHDLLSMPADDHAKPPMPRSSRRKSRFRTPLATVRNA